MNNDPYDPSIPKYTTASEIHEALQVLTNTEEMAILSDFVPDVSYHGQDYYYSDEGYKLLERFEKISGFGERYWALDMAIWQMDKTDIQDVIWEALHNPDLARRLHFKTLVVNGFLYERKGDYDKFAEEFCYEMEELNYFDYHSMLSALGKVLRARGREPYFYVPQYNHFLYELGKHAMGLRLYDEKQIITECRALLTSYDDFMLGLKMNQALHDYQEQQFAQKVARLQEFYDEKVRQLHLLAERNGIALPPLENVMLLTEFEQQEEMRRDEGKKEALNEKVE